MRKLAIVSAAFSLAVFTANYILSTAWLLPASAAAAALGALLLSARRKWLRGVILTAFGLSAGLLCFAVHAQFTTVPAHILDGQTVTFRASVASYPREYEDYSSVELRLSVEGYPTLRTVAYDRTGALSGARPGDGVAGTAVLHTADLRYGEAYDRYNAQNIYLTATLGEDLRLTRQRDGALRGLFARLRHALSERIGRIFPEDTAAYFQSLLLGDKSGLYRDDALYLAMSRTGFMHIVAVSGMHVAALVAFLQYLMGVGRRSSLVCLLVVWGFVLMTGCSPSAIRAAFMQTTLLLAPLLRRENDPPTSLMTALALLLAANPHAAASVSLQLSFAAMAGLMLVGERLSPELPCRGKKKWQRALASYLTGTAASSLGVLLFTLPLIALHFGYVSVLSPVANLLALWTVPICFSGGFLSCALSYLSLPLGQAAAWLLSWPARFLFLVARLVSSVPFSAVYMRNRTNVFWLALVYLLALIVWRSYWPRWKKLLIPAVLAGAALFVSLFSARLYYRGEGGFVTVLNVGQGQSIAVFSEESTLLIDCGSIHSLDNAGDVAAAYLKSCGREAVDVLMLTHLHSDHANGVVRLLESIPVGTILMPADPDNEDGMLEPILAAAQRHGTQLRCLARDEELGLGGVRLRLFAPGSAGDANERCLTAAVSIGSFDMLVTGDIDKTAERDLLARQELRDMELLIVGHHGSRYAASGELLSAIGADTAVVSVGYNNFGHPTQETLERLDAYGYNVYRTDLNGDVEFRISQENTWQGKTRAN